jgi:hypothetical protein
LALTRTQYNIHLIKPIGDAPCFGRLPGRRRSKLSPYTGIFSPSAVINLSHISLEELELSIGALFCSDRSLGNPFLLAQLLSIDLLQASDLSIMLLLGCGRALSKDYIFTAGSTEIGF